MTYFDPEALLADARRKRARSEETARRARAKLGVPATRKSGELFYSDGRGPLGWLYEDGEDPDLVIRDSASLKGYFDLFKSHRRLRGNQRSVLQLPSGRSVVFYPKTGKLMRPDEADAPARSTTSSVQYAVPRPRGRRGASA